MRIHRNSFIISRILPIHRVTEMTVSWSDDSCYSSIVILQFDKNENESIFKELHNFLSAIRYYLDNLWINYTASH